MVLVSLVGVVVAIVYGRLRRGSGTRDAVLEALIIAGTVPWLFLLLRPGTQPDGKHFLVPFSDLAQQVRVGGRYAATQIGGNLLVFSAFGLFGPIRWRLRLAGVVGVAALASAIIEGTQYLQHHGRVASVDDILVNAVGAGLCALVTRRWWRVRHQSVTSPRMSAGAGTVAQR